MYAPRATETLTLSAFANPYLDAEIIEFEKALLKCKKERHRDLKKTNQFYKALPENWKLHLTKMYNRILDNEIIPSGWGKSTLTMIYKKGDKNDPLNHRGIALINSVTKILTQILKDSRGMVQRVKDSPGNATQI